MLIEEVLREFKRTHLEHIEDIILTGGHAGWPSSDRLFHGHIQYVEGQLIRTTGVGQMGRCTGGGMWHQSRQWSFLRGHQIGVRTGGQDQLHQTGHRCNHGTDDLGQKLLKCLAHLPKLNIKGVVQGDMMFTDNDLTSRDINGKPFFTFKPNEIVYAVPVDSDIGKQIEQAKLGIIFHTTYVGETLADMNAEAGADVSKFTKTADVWFDNATYKNVSGSATFTAGESAQFAEGINILKSLLAKVPQNLSAMLTANKDFIPMFQMFINSEIKQGRIPTDANEFMKGFQQFYLSRMNQQMTGLKAQKAIALRQQKMAEMPKFLNTMRKPLQAMLAFYKQTQALKAEALQKMNQAAQVGTFAQTENGLEVTDPEGFRGSGHGWWCRQTGG
jgi:hypothetical protein